jgi:hypothetical protein
MYGQKCIRCVSAQQRKPQKMKKAVLSLLGLFGTWALSPGYVMAAPMSLMITAACNYDAVGTQNEITYANTKTGNHRLTDILGGHNLAQAGMALTSTASLSSGTAMPPYGVIGNYAGSFAYDKNSSGTYSASSNCVHLIASATSSTTVSASITIPLTSTVTDASGGHSVNEEYNYNDLNFLFVQCRSTGAGTYRTIISVTYTDGTTATLKDTGAVTVAANGAGGTIGSAGIGGQGGLNNSTDTDTSVTNEYSSPYGVVTTGTSGSYSSVISSTAGSNLWQMTTPLALTSSKVLASVTFQVQASQAGMWNELTVFGMDADLTPYTPPPASDPAATLTFTPTSRMSAHPRIMITPATIASIQAFYNNTAQSQIWRNEFDAYVPACVPPSDDTVLIDATEAQRQGLWRLPTVALDYVINGRQSSLTNAIGFLQFYLALPDWETSLERNSGMAAANNMVGVALAYDWLYNNLDPTFREQVREKLFAQARALYYGGFLEQNSNIAAIYWQVDPLNNQRWHRDAGFVLGVIASYDGNASENYMMNAAAKEAALVNQWLAPDGSSHESASYQVFGGSHLMMAEQASDDNFGTNLLSAPYFQNIGTWYMQLQTASFKGTLDFGDYSGYDDDGSYGNFLLECANKNNDANLRAGVLQLYANNPAAITFSWWSFLWDNPNLTGGTWTGVPLTGYYSDLGISTYRDSWTPGGVTAMFKCSPLGGISINQYRDANNETYINVAHDDPDANSFIFFMGDDGMMWSDWYSQRKQSSQQNTILVNNLGQNPSGRSPAAQVFSAPATSGSMLGMAKSFTPVTLVNGTIVSEGEAAGSYPALTTPGVRPALTRYRRLFMWAGNKYMLVLDDIRSATSATYAQLIQGPAVTAVNTTLGQFNLATGTHSCLFQVVGSQALTYSIVASTADNRSTSLGYEQLQSSATGTSLQLASIFNPWAVSNLSVAIQNQTPTTEDIAVTGSGVADTYRWTYATGSTTASSIIPLIAPSITSAAPASPATLGVPYNFTVTATGSPAAGFTVPANTLPPGLTLSSAGVISGTPTETGLFTGTITASNGIGTAATQGFSINVVGGYSAWVVQEGLSGNKAQMTAINAPDGLTNLLKYSLGLHAFTAYNPGSASLPFVEVKNYSDTNYLALTFTGVATDVTYNVQATSDLTGAWTTIYTYKGSPAPGTVVVQDTQAIPTSNPSRRYLRLNVTSP